MISPSKRIDFLFGSLILFLLLLIVHKLTPKASTQINSVISKKSLLPINRKLSSLSPTNIVEESRHISLRNLSVALNIDLVLPNGNLGLRKCQGTLVSRKTMGSASVCSILTAAHCLVYEGEKVKILQVKIDRYGTVLNPEYVYDTRSKSSEGVSQLSDIRYDVGLIHFKKDCEKIPENEIVPMHPIDSKADDSFIHDPKVYAAFLNRGKLANASLRSSQTEFAQNGFLTIYFDPTQNNSPTESTLRGLKNGDSGGGLFIENKSENRMELIGIASGGRLDGDDRDGSIKTRYSYPYQWIQENLPR